MPWTIRETDLPSIVGGQVLCQSSPNRWALHISNPSLVVAEITTRPPNPNPNGGMPIQPGAVQSFYFVRDGGLARETFYAGPLSGVTDIHVMESLWYPDGETGNGQNT